MINKVRLEELCTPKSSNLAQKDILENHGEHPVYGASGFIKKVDFYHQENEYIAVVKDGAGIGRTSYFPPKSSIIGTMQYLIPKNNVYPKYLYYAVKAMNLAKYYSGATIPHIYFRDYKKELVPLYTGDQQKVISFSLEKLEHILSLKQQQLIEYDQLIKSRFVEMFGDPIKNDKQWDIKSLDEICDVRDGTHDSPKYFNVGYPLITSKNISNGSIDYSTAQLICEEDYQKINKRSKVDNGDILMPMIGTVGGAVIVDKNQEFAIKNVALIKFNTDLVGNVFIKYVLNSDQMNLYFEDLKKGGTQKFIGLKTIRNLPIIVPSIQLQTNYASLVEQIDKLKFEECFMHNLNRNARLTKITLIG